MPAKQPIQEISVKPSAGFGKAARLTFRGAHILSTTGSCHEHLLPPSLDKKNFSPPPIEPPEGGPLAESAISAQRGSAGRALPAECHRGRPDRPLPLDHRRRQQHS